MTMALSSLVAIFFAACGVATISGNPMTPVGYKVGNQPCYCYAPGTCTARGLATYNVMLDFTWPSSNYKMPTNPHWSPPVFVTHTPCSVIWRNNIAPSPGLKSLAETGNDATIQQEVNGLTLHHLSYSKGSQLNAGIGRRSSTVFVDNQRYALTALSSISPSPDWFVGIDSVQLCVNNTFLDSVVLDLYPMDAGTDSGRSYNAPNQDQNTRDNVTRIYPDSGTDVFAMGGSPRVPIGTLTITKTAVARSKTPPSNLFCQRCSPATNCKSGTTVETMMSAASKITGGSVLSLMITAATACFLLAK